MGRVRSFKYVQLPTLLLIRLWSGFPFPSRICFPEFVTLFLRETAHLSLRCVWRALLIAGTEVMHRMLRVLVQWYCLVM